MKVLASMMVLPVVTYDGGDESARPEPKLRLYRQGLHPNPGPGESTLASVWDDPYWEKCG